MIAIKSWYHPKHDDGYEAIPQVSFNDFDLSWYVWTILKMTDYRWTINDILEQPDHIMADVLKLNRLTAGLLELQQINPYGEAP